MDLVGHEFLIPLLAQNIHNWRGDDDDMALVSFIKHLEPPNTDGGALPSGDDAGQWGRQRTLNTLQGDTGFVSLSSNQFTLSSGQYDLIGVFALYDTGRTGTAVFEAGSSTPFIEGQAQFIRQNSSVIVMQRFTLTESKTFEVRHKTQRNQPGTRAQGRPINYGTTVVGDYANIRIAKLS